MLGDRIADAPPGTSHHESREDPVLVGLRPPVLVYLRIAWTARPDGGVDVRGEGRVPGARASEHQIGLRHRVLHQPLLFKRPVRFACRSAHRNARMPSGIEIAPTRSAGQSSGQMAATSAPSRSAARIPRTTYVAGEMKDRTCIHPGRMLVS